LGLKDLLVFSGALCFSVASNNTQCWGCFWGGFITNQCWGTADLMPAAFCSHLSSRRCR